MGSVCTCGGASDDLEIVKINGEDSALLILKIQCALRRYLAHKKVHQMRGSPLHAGKRTPTISRSGSLPGNAVSFANPVTEAKLREIGPYKYPERPNGDTTLSRNS